MFCGKQGYLGIRSRQVYRPTLFVNSVQIPSQYRVLMVTSFEIAFTILISPSCVNDVRVFIFETIGRQPCVNILPSICRRQRRKSPSRASAAAAAAAWTLAGGAAFAPRRAGGRAGWRIDGTYRTRPHSEVVIDRKSNTVCCPLERG